MDEAYQMNFRRQIDQDPLDQWKDAKVDAQIAESEEREELRQKLCEAMGIIGKTGACGHPVKIALDANLLATAKAKLLTTDELRGYFTRNLTAQCPEDHFWPRAWALTQSTEVQQARTLLEAIKNKESQ